MAKCGRAERPTRRGPARGGPQASAFACGARGAGHSAPGCNSSSGRMFHQMNNTRRGGMKLGTSSNVHWCTKIQRFNLPKAVIFISRSRCKVQADFASCRACLASFHASMALMQNLREIMNITRKSLCSSEFNNCLLKVPFCGSDTLPPGGARLSSGSEAPLRSSEASPPGSELLPPGKLLRRGSNRVLEV